MSNKLANSKEWQLVTQALLDGEGYPKSEEQYRQLSYSTQNIRKLLDELFENHYKELNTIEKQMILNCIDGAMHYVDIDIPSLYDISELELNKFKEELEERWNMRSAYVK